MGKRKGMALSETEFIAIKGIIKQKCNQKQAQELINFMDIMVKIGIRRSEWKILAEAFEKYKTQAFEIWIPKQTKNKNNDEKQNILIKRLVKLPKNIFEQLRNGTYQLNNYGGEWVYKKTAQIRELIRNTEIDRPLMPHDFRHTFIMFAKHRGWDIYDVKSATQHASISALENYFSNDTDIIMAIYDSMDSDYYDVKNPAKLMKELNKAKIKLAYLEAENKNLKNQLKKERK